MSARVRVTPTEDGAVISVDGVEITVVVKAKESVSTLAATTPVAQRDEEQRITVELVRGRLAAFLPDLTVTDEAEGILVKPTGYLGRDKFTSIASAVRELGGRYVSAGRDSRFVIPVG